MFKKNTVKYFNHCLEGTIIVLTFLIVNEIKAARVRTHTHTPKMLENLVQFPCGEI